MGNIQLPNPPIATGITKKKIIKIACAVTIALYNWKLPNKSPGVPNSKRIKKESLAPNKPLQIPTRKYKVPISLWLILQNQRVKE